MPHQVRQPAGIKKESSSLIEVIQDVEVDQSKRDHKSQNGSKCRVQPLLRARQLADFYAPSRLQTFLVHLPDLRISWIAFQRYHASASPQINMSKVDGWQALATKPMMRPIHADQRIPSTTSRIICIKKCLRGLRSRTAYCQIGIFASARNLDNAHSVS